MFTKITNPVSYVYDRETGNFVAEENFTLSSGAKQSLLDLLNYNITPKELILINLFCQPSDFFIPPSVEKPVKRAGVIKATATDLASGMQVPVEVYMTFDSSAHGNYLQDQHYFDSVVYSNIRVESIVY